MQITNAGRTQSVSAWASELGITYDALHTRLKHQPLERALTPNPSGQRMITHAGRTQNFTAWARELGLTFHGLKARLQRGEPIEEALSYRRHHRGR